MNAKNKKTSIVCPRLFKCYSPVSSIFRSNALVFGIDLYLLVVLFYRGLEFTEPREIEFDFKEAPK